jgi:hypothetical protein
MRVQRFLAWSTGASTKLSSAVVENPVGNGLGDSMTCGNKFV